MADFLDGTGGSLLAADVKLNQPFSRCNGNNGILSGLVYPGSIPSPNAAPFTVAAEYNGCGSPVGVDHSFWADGNAHETARTTAWSPNRAILGRNNEASVSPAATSPAGDLDLESNLVVQNAPGEGARRRISSSLSNFSVPPRGA